MLGQFIIPSPQGESGEKDRQLLQGFTPFACSLCDYPILSSWKFCPHCGGQVLWAHNVSEGTDASKET